MKKGKPDKTAKAFLDAMPGLTGDIARFIYSRLEFDQPALAMGTAISFVGALKSNRFKNRFNIPTNVYVAGIANSGTGKSQCQKAVQKICIEAECRDILMGKPASDAGLISALEQNPRQFLIWDELGIGLSAISKSRSSHDAKIPALMMELFSASDSLYIGSQYSNKTQSAKRVDIEKPCLSIFGVSTPVRFYGSLTENFVHDGFLSRWLVFPGEEQIRGKTAEEYEVPKNIVTRVRRLEKGIESFESGGDLPKHHITEIEFQDEVFIDAFRDSCKQKVIDAKSDIERVFYTRMFELGVKLCCIMAENYTCTNEDLGFVIPLIEYLVEGAAKACLDNLFSTDAQRNESDMEKKVLELFTVGATLTRTQIYTLIRRDKKLRNQTLIDLVEAGYLHEESQTLPGAKKPTSFYTRIK